MRINGQIPFHTTAPNTQKPYKMINKNHVPRLSLAALAATAIIATTSQAAILPTLSNPPTWADTEETWEGEFEPFDGRQNEFKITLAFTPTPSNNLEFAIWDSTTGKDEPEAVIGWDCGEVFLEFGGLRGTCTGVPESEPLTISLVMRLSRDGDVHESIIKANGTTLDFYDVGNEPVVFGFSTGWDAARVVSRGVGAMNERVSFGFTADPSVISVR